jgi:predicted negative regulator of RcsB-dependent stress response
MATHLDFEEQEQLDQLKAFWKQYGNLITWTLTLALAAFAAWNGWNWWQREQAGKASAMYDELSRAVLAGDAERSSGIFKDMRERFARTAFTEQAGLLTAKVQVEKKQADAAQATLAWVADNAVETEYRTIARLRLAGLLTDAKKYDAALEQLEGATGKEFEALVADRRGDILLAQGKTDEAKAAYLAAWKAMDDKVGYRRLIDAKLTSLGAPPPAETPKTGAAAGTAP